LSKTHPLEKIFFAKKILPSRFGEGDKTAFFQSFLTPHDSTKLTTVNLLEWRSLRKVGELEPLALGAFLHKKFHQLFFLN